MFNSTTERGSYRAWLRWGKNMRLSLELCWRSNALHIGFEFDEEHGWGAFVALPPFALYVHLRVPKALSLRDSRTIRLSYHAKALWWVIWRDELSGWSREVPKWQQGSFHFDDFILGKAVCSKAVLEERNILVPMPEKAYKATAKLMAYTWERPRWFTKRIKRVEIDIPEGIPHEGKGENSWDCGKDATYGMTTGECNSIIEGIGQLVTSCLRDRIRYGGWGDYVWNK